MRKTLWRFLFAPIDIASLAVFRIGFGLLMAYEIYDCLESGVVKAHYVDPRFHFTWLLFDWVKPWPGVGTYLHFYALIALSLCIAAGLFYRASAALFCLGITYLFLLDQAMYLNHWYLICLLGFLMILLPAHHALSVDAWLRPGLRSEQAPAWALWLLRAQMGVVYFFGGVAKLNADWLQGRPMDQWFPGSIGLPLLEPVLAHPASALLISWGGLLLDLFIVPALLWRRTRPYAFAAALGFHLINSEMFEIGVFPWLAIWCTAAFFDADWPRRVFNWPRESALPPAPAVRWDAGARATLAFLSAYMAIQLLLPLRHFLYPGNVSWTEEGHRFSWHMKLRYKDAMASFRLTDPETGRNWQVDPSAELTARQVRKMAADPFMLQQYAHHLADLVTQPGRQRFEVRAIAAASLNGHLAEPIVDPTVDLAAVPRTLFGPNDWILPQNNELGRRVRATLPENPSGPGSRRDQASVE
ncbi:MAG TPA: HTTM domain-containing protein [Myxococcota bacterium]|jgi:hypothetical protein